jgi:glucose-6-phosphate isomerase, archaeal
MFGWEGELPQPTKRMVEDMRPVLFDPQCRCNDPLYFMYRDLSRSDTDWQWLHEHRLRYDLTVIPPRDLCGERVKTKGHYHPKNAAGVGYPEIYEVFEGTAHYLLQSCTLDDIVLITADAGDLVVIPPDYGHITINPSPDETLSMANIVSTAFESEYGEYEARHGAAWYELSDDTFVRNPAYTNAPPVRRLEASCRRGTQRICKGPLYDHVGKGDSLAFLNFPERYLSVFKALLKG